MNFFLVLIGLAVLLGGGVLVGTNTLDYSTPTTGPPVYEPVNETITTPPSNNTLDWIDAYTVKPCTNFLLRMPWHEARKVGGYWCDAVSWSKGFLYRIGFDPFNTLFTVAIVLGVMLFLSHFNIGLGGGIQKYIIFIGIIILLIMVAGGP